MNYPRHHTPSRRLWLTRFVALALMTGLVVTACGSNKGDTAGTDSGSASTTGWQPSKDIDFIVPNSPGGGFDTYARGIAEVMQPSMPNGVSVVVRNQPPEPQGITMMYSAKPDGTTIGILPMPAAIAHQIENPDLAKWQTDKFTVLGSVDENAYVVYVASNSPYTSIEDLVAKKGLRALSVQEGSSSALAAQATIKSLGLDANITYGADGSAEVVTGLIRGDADFIVYGSTDLTGFVESGDIKPILFLGTEDQRPKSLPWLADVPSADSKGFTGLGGAVTELRLIVGPAGMPDDVATYFRDAIYATISSPEFESWAQGAKRPITPRDWKAATDIMNTQVEQMNELVPSLTS
jgi:tripartite-type tricarboxylate transporter receptor subunit TctC